MIKKAITIATILVICLTAITNNVYANTPIDPINNVYKEGIYNLNKDDNGEYQLLFKMDMRYFLVGN